MKRSSPNLAIFAGWYGIEYVMVITHDRYYVIAF